MSKGFFGTRNIEAQPKQAGESPVPLLHRAFDRQATGQVTDPKLGRSNRLGAWAWVYSRLAESDAERSAYLTQRCKDMPWEDEQ